MASPLDDITKLVGRVLLVLNVDDDILNLRDLRTNEQFWIETTGTLLVFKREEVTTDGLMER